MNNEKLQPPIRIGIDTGGTFTDYVIVSEGHIRAWKTPTTPTDPSEGIIFGFNEIMEKFHFQPNDVEIIVHGTTIGTNAFLEDKCPPIAFLTTKGFKDIIEIGRQQRSDLYNLKFKQKYPLNFEKDLLYEIEERVNSEGQIIENLNLSTINNIISDLKSQSIKTVALSFLFSFLNPLHEKQLTQSLSDKGYNVFPSHETSPQIREYERSVTTLVNAKVSPVVNSYLSRLKAKLVERNINAPLLIMQSNTGMTDVSNIVKAGIQTLYSGLAGGVLAAADSLKHLNRTHLVSLDIGGTSTDVSALIDGPIVLRSRDFGGFPLVASMVDVETIGSGGGSIAKFKDGLLSVGPESQGANPGPACYSLGGDIVTLTDTNLHLGYVHQDNFAGNLKIDKEKSVLYLNKLLQDIKSSSFSLEIDSIDDLAISVRKILNNNIANAIRVVTIQRGLDPRDFALLGFGGAGPLQAWDIAQELEMGGVIIPPFPGVWSAFGLVTSDIKHEITHSYLQTIDALNFDEINTRFLEIQEKLKAILNSEDVSEENQTFLFSIDMRYRGQSDSLTLDINFPLKQEQLANVIERYHVMHNQNYSWFDKKLIVEIVNVSVTGIGKVPRIELPVLSEGSEKPPEDSYKKSRKVNFDGIWLDTPVFDKSKLLSNNILVGPCIVDQLDTTTVIPPNVKGIVNKLGYIAMEEEKMNAKFSLIEAQVINQALTNVALETGIVLQRSAFSPNIRDRLDFSSAIMDQSGKLIAQAEHIPVHLGAMPEGVKALIKHFGEENILDGDIYIANNPYLGGTHLPDISVVKPIFFDRQLVGYIANRCHHADVGGVVPGSMPGGKYTLEEEGFVIDPTILERNGVLNEEWFNYFLSKIRVPVERRGDIQAQLASTKIGEKKFHALLNKYSLERVQQIIDFLNERSKKASLELIQKIPENQRVTYTDYMDNDGVKDEPIAITAEVERKGEKLIVDYSKTDSQVEGNINAPYAVTFSATYYILRCLVSREYATNHGLYQPLEIITKEGTLIHPLPPAGVAAGNVETSQRITDVLLGVFSQLFPDEVPAASSGTMNNIIIGGFDSKGTQFTYYETIAGGIGAGKDYSPPNAKHSHMTNTRNTSVEVLEKYYPLRIHEYSIIPDTGGKGKWSGSNSVRRTVELIADEAILSIQSERRKHSPFGLLGGSAGTKGNNILKRGDESIRLPAKVTKEIKKGDIVIIETPGGGGYGTA